MPDLDAAKGTLLAELREHSLILGEVTLASGAIAQYYVDARRTLMRPAGFRAAGELIAAAAAEVGAEAVGGPATAAIPPACAAIAVPSGADLVAFFVRGERKEHGLQRWVEGPVEPGPALPRRRGHRHHRRLDRDRDRADPRGGAGGRRRRRGRRPARRRRREDRSGGRGSLPRPGHDRRDLPRAAGPRLRRSVEPDAVEIRVVGCLIEKQRTTPDVYPLSLNALRTGLQPVDQPRPGRRLRRGDRREALRRLALRGWTRLASGAGSRARKYRHLLPEALGVDDAELSLLAVLMLRGAQTPGELKQRSERLHGFADLAAVEATLDGSGRARLRRPPRAPAGPEGGALRAAARRCRGGIRRPSPRRRRRRPLTAGWDAPNCVGSRPRTGSPARARLRRCAPNWPPARGARREG